MGMGLTSSAGGLYSGPPELGAKTAVSLPAGMESERGGVPLHLAESLLLKETFLSEYLGLL